MKIAIGVDTGGTYTDAVLYDFDEKKILAGAKALTTKEDLCIGIANALDALPQELFARVRMVSLSTTLATNACVENKGGNAKLIFSEAIRSFWTATARSTVCRPPPRSGYRPARRDWTAVSRSRPTGKNSKKRRPLF